MGLFLFRITWAWAASCPAGWRGTCSRRTMAAWRGDRPMRHAASRDKVQGSNNNNLNKSISKDIMLLHITIFFLEHLSISQLFVHCFTVKFNSIPSFLLAMKSLLLLLSAIQMKTINSLIAIGPKCSKNWLKVSNIKIVPLIHGN